MTTRHKIILIAITVFALCLRLIAARHAYPTPGDSSHFVQHGVALAHGIPGSMSTYWSQGMITLAAGAVKVGLDPRRFLQAASIISGTYVVFGGMLIVLRLGAPALAAWIFGLLAATNSGLLHYSSTGYSEMTYMAFLVLAVHVGLIARAKAGTTISWFLTFLSGSLLGLGGYFKGLDAVVALGSFGLYHLVARVESWNATFRRCILLATATFIILMPLCLFTYKHTGKFAPGSKGGNLSTGLEWVDSKKVYTPDSPIFTKSANQVIRELPARIRQNVPDIFREFNGMMFVYGFRVGTIWYAVFILLVGWTLWSQRRLCAAPLSLLLPQLFLLSLVFVHARILCPSLPWLLMLCSVAFAAMWSLGSGLRIKAAMLFSFIIYIVMSVEFARKTFPQEFFYWRYPHLVEMAQRMKGYVKDDEVMMVHDGTLPAEFYDFNPLLSVGMPYGDLDVVEEVAAKRKASIIVVSDSYYAHWPVAGVFCSSVVLPHNWKVIAVEQFDGENHPERMCVIRRGGESGGP